MSLLVSALTMLAQAPGGVSARVDELNQARNTTPVHGPHYLEAWLESLLGIRFDEYVGLDIVMVAVLMLVVCLVVFGFINLFGLFSVWMERKVSAHMQCRLGPMEVGPHGTLQTLADGLKLVAKEDVIPRLVSRPLFAIAPILVFTGVLIRYVPVPFGEDIVASDLHLGLFFVAAVGSTEALGVIMAGWASNNKWSLFATIRAVTQMVSYEIPLGLAFVTVIALAGSFSLQEIVAQQEGWFVSWFVFRNPFMPILLVVYFVASLAECKRAPFDLPEAESELVSGFHTEYGGMRFALFFLAEYGAMYLVAALGVALFLGGWWVGIPAIDAIGKAPDASPALVTFGRLIGVGVFVGKALVVVFVQMWVRWTLPRVRLDQMMHLCWKVLLPAAMISLVGAALWDLMSGGGALFGLL